MPAVCGPARLETVSAVALISISRSAKLTHKALKSIESKLMNSL